MTEDGRLFIDTAMPDGRFWRALWPDPAAVLRALGFGPGMTVPDLCCGDGYFTLPLAELTGGAVYALDLDPEMLRRAREAAARRGVPVRRWIAADARETPRHVPEPVDAVLLANALHGVPDKAGLAQTAAAVLKPGGRLVVVNWHRRPREETTVLGEARGPDTRLRMTPEDTRDAVEPAGFASPQVIEIPPHHYGARFLRPGGKS